MKHDTGLPYSVEAREIPVGRNRRSGSPSIEGLSTVRLRLVRYVYYLFILSLPFETVISQYIPAGSTASRSLGILLIILTVGNPRLYFGRLPRALWCFVAYLGVYVILALLQGSSLSVVASGISTWVQLLILFCVSLNLMLSVRAVTATLWSLVLSCTLLGILQAVGLTVVIEDDRVSTLGANANTLAGILCLGLLALTGLAWGRDKIRLLSRLFFVFSAAILIVGIVRTGSRGAAIALAISLLAFVMKKGKTLISKFKTAAIVTLLLCVFALISLQSEFVRVRWIASLDAGDVAGRDEIFPAAWEMFLERPLTGWGPATHLVELGHRLGLSYPRDPHNLYLWVLNEVGLLGAIPFFIGLYYCFRAAWKGRLGLQGILPLVMMIFVTILNFKGTYHELKLFWIVLAYALASAEYPNLVPTYLSKERTRANTLLQLKTRSLRLNKPPLTTYRPNV